jgi:hypothetical protein
MLEDAGHATIIEATGFYKGCIVPLGHQLIFYL